MKIISIKKKNLLKMVIGAIFIIIVCGYTTSFSMQHYYKLDFSTGLVTATTLNVRSGPGTQYKIVATIRKNEYIRVFAGVGDWYIVQVEGDYVGAVNKKYVKAIYPNSNNNSNNVSTIEKNNNVIVNSDINADEKEVFNLINNQRTNNGLSTLKFDNELQKVARIKAEDMVTNNYFSHQSPIYGSPFDMLRNFKILYKTAGENIAANSSNSGAVNAWMNSSGHKDNILNSSFNYTGIGVVSSPKYGKIFVQMFIGK